METTTGEKVFLAQNFLQAGHQAALQLQHVLDAFRQFFAADRSDLDIPFARLTEQSVVFESFGKGSAH